MSESTRFVSPTKTPEYLCAGRPVVSTPIADIIDPYGKKLLVSIAAESSDFIAAIEYWLNCEHKTQWLDRTDKFLLTMSWDITFSDILLCMVKTIVGRKLAEKEHHNMTYLTAIFGISDIFALEILSETGTDMSKWESSKHLFHG